MNTLLLIISILVAFILLLKIWNKYSKQYNYNILKNASCKNCQTLLGIESLERAIKKLAIEKEQLKKEKIGTLPFIIWN